MSTKWQAVGSWLLRQAPTVAVFCGLFALGVWGHHNDWKAPSLAALLGGKEKDSDKPKSDQDEDKDPASLELPKGGAENAGVQDAPVESQNLAESVDAPAVLAFDHIRHAQVSPRVIGTAWRIFRHEGEDVKKGELLALLVSDNVGTAKAELLTARVQHEVRLQTLQRLRNSAADVPDRAIREAEQNAREAKTRLINAQQALVNLGLPLHLDELNNLGDEEVATRVRLLGLPDPKTWPHKHTHASRSHEPNLDVNDKDLPGNLLPLVAPFDGLVVRHDLNVGEVASPSSPAFVVSDVSRLAVMIDLRQEDAARLKPTFDPKTGERWYGQKVTFRANTTQQTAEGTLRWVSAEVDLKTRTVRARADAPNPDRQLRPATFGRVRIEVRSKSALTVPDTALQWDGNSHRVFVRLDEDTFDPRVALLGDRMSGRTELLDNRALQAASVLGGSALATGPLSGLASLLAGRRMLREVRPGERVVTTGSHVLKCAFLKDRISGED